MRAALVAAAAAASALGAHAASVPRTNLTDPLARCMDGTLSAYYLQPSSTPRGAGKWVLYLEGGGECTTEVVSLSLRASFHRNDVARIFDA